ncbi:WD repeat domain phosphoinositide-interacting protein 2 isoform X2 [Dendroctonus ponderosae]|uniref:WD repeat domain phosphoinositide-interacting protein 2 n=1 Tax=Dendroctonus ponderosae TaxID=77166 RepID=A0AAR5QAJ8_DENPD|nr:WD repeat domain phosphoinositide-interacting protein 2 isoform X2 [Dendroctonus ponderosae]
MSSPSAADSNGPKSYFVNFNQDSTSLVVGGQFGYRVLSLESVDFLSEIYNNATEHSCIVERLFSSSLIAVVSLSFPRKLKITHYKKGTEICNYSYTNTILGVKLNRARVVVCLEESLYLHNIRDMKVLHTIRDTPPNPRGLCALSSNSENCYLAYPGSSSVGEVQVFDAMNLTAKIMIHAHDSALAALAFAPSGLSIGTASERGTVIRVFSVSDGSKLFEFRRGVKRCVNISCLSFSMCGHFLLCSSNTETVHIFKLEEASKESKKTIDEGTWMGMLSSYLPSSVTDTLSTLNQDRAYATATLPCAGVKNVISLVYIGDGLRLLVATENGFLYIFNFDANVGGELQLYKTHQLDDLNGDQSDGGQKVASGDKAGSGLLGSYAGIVKGNSPGEMSESEKVREMERAAEAPPQDAFHFTDDQEYPPLTQNSDLN